MITKPQLKYYLVTIEEHNGEQTYLTRKIIRSQSADVTLEVVKQYVIDEVLKCWYGAFDSEEGGYTSLESYDEQYGIANLDRKSVV